jgi:septal ring factor EnvC (AmiA/AmiB activator)
MKLPGLKEGLVLTLSLLFWLPEASAAQMPSAGAAVSAAGVKKKSSAAVQQRKPAGRPAPKNRSGAVQVTKADVQKVRQKKEELEQKRKSTQTKIEKIESEVSEKSLEKKRLEEQLAGTAEAITQTRQKITNIRNERRKVENDLSRQQAEIRKLQKQIAAEQKVLDKTTQERLKLIGANTSPKWRESNHESFRTEALLEVLGKQTQDSLAALNSKRKQLESVQLRSERTKEDLRNIARTEMSVRDQLIKERNDRQKAAAALQSELNRHALSLTRLKRDESRLSDLVAGLAKREARDAARLAAAGSAAKAAESVPQSPKGRAVYPVEGKLVARFGEKRQGGKDLGNWKGMVFSVKDETAVHAAKSGKVVFADYLRGYGNMIIIDHGSGYFSVYGNNVRLDKDVGDRVAAGEIISWVGSRESDLSVLYFEVRYKGRAVDPAKWL